MGLKSRLVRALRSEALQPFWERMARLARVGMNHYGGADHRHSGEDHVLRFVARQADPGHGTQVIDVGAHEGHYTAMALRILGERVRVDCFEPSSTARPNLLSLLSHELSTARVRAFDQALGDADGTVTLYSPKPGSSFASLYPFDPETRAQILPGEQETIDMTTLDAHADRHGIDRILLLKIDVEGHELHVLRGAKGLLERRAIQFIQFEFGEADIDSRTFFHDFFHLLHPTHDLYRVLPRGLHRIDAYEPDLEVFRVTNYLAVLRS